MSVRYVGGATLSPANNLSAFVMSEVKGKGDKERQVQSIWQVATDGSSQPKKLTSGSGSSWSPQYSRDGTWLYFLSTRTKTPQVYRLPLAGGESEQVTSLEQGVSLFTLCPNGRDILISTNSEKPEPRTDNDHPRISRAWYRFDPIQGVMTQDIKQTVFLVKGTGKPKAIYETAGVISQLRLTAKGDRVALLQTCLENQSFFQSDLVVLNPGQNNRAKTLLQNQLITDLEWLNDNQLLLHGTPGDLANQAALFVLDTETGRQTDRTTALDIMAGVGVNGHSPVRVTSRLIPAADGKSTLSSMSRGGTVNVERVTLTGRKDSSPVTRGQHVAILQDANDTTLLTIRHSPNAPLSLWATDIQSGVDTELTSLNQALFAKVLLPGVERVKFKSAPGVNLEGWVLTPRNARPPYKTLLMIHGGPHAAYGETFSFDFQALAGAGYAVAYMNPRGSTGYGNQFTRSILGQWGDPELKDFNAFLDTLVASGISHPDKLGVTGISGGGHLSGWLIGPTHRFKAGVPDQGVYSMLSMWGPRDGGVRLIGLEMGGKPHKIPMTYWQRSPVAHAHKCKTPTLLLQGEDDVRCPMEQAEQMYMTLKEHGCKTEFVRMKNCSHGAQIGGRPALRRFRLDALLDWVGQHIR